MIESGRFQARGESGTIYTVVEFQHMTFYTPTDGVTQKHKGSTELFLDDGRDVSPAPDGRFKVVLTDELLDRI